MRENYEPPAFQKNAFNCPFCGAFAHQDWTQQLSLHFLASNQTVGADKIAICRCNRCKGLSIWCGHALTFPESSTAPPAHIEAPDEIASDLEEARSIVSRSPRGAAALYRLAIQKLCVHLGRNGKNLNQDIGDLVKQGLNPKIQKALDVVRVIGNEAVHPGVLDLEDDAETAQKLGAVINLIVEATIAQPKLIDELYQNLPAEKRLSIERRDGETQGD